MLKCYKIIYFYAIKQVNLKVNSQERVKILDFIDGEVSRELINYFGEINKVFCRWSN